MIWVKLSRSAKPARCWWRFEQLSRVKCAEQTNKVELKLSEILLQIPWEGYDVFQHSLHSLDWLPFALLLLHCHCFVLHNTGRAAEVLGLQVHGNITWAKTCGRCRQILRVYILTHHFCYDMILELVHFITLSCLCKNVQCMSVPCIINSPFSMPR